MITIVMKIEMALEVMPDTPFKIISVLLVVVLVVVSLVVSVLLVVVSVVVSVLLVVVSVVVSIQVVVQHSLQSPDRSVQCFVQSQSRFLHILASNAFSSSQQSISLHFATVRFSLRQSPPSLAYFAEFINSLHLPSPQQK